MIDIEGGGGGGEAKKAAKEEDRVRDSTTMKLHHIRGVGEGREGGRGGGGGS